MNTQVQNPKLSNNVSKLAREVITGFLTFALVITGLSYASATVLNDLPEAAFNVSVGDDAIVITLDTGTFNENVDTSDFTFTGTNSVDISAGTIIRNSVSEVVISTVNLAAATDDKVVVEGGALTIQGSTATVTSGTKVATPVISASKTSASNREADVKFTIGAVAGVTFYYTLDGTSPTSGSTEYTGDVTLTAPASDSSASIVIKAIGVKTGSIDSAIGTETVAYAAKPTVATPVISASATSNSATESAAIRAANEAAAKAEAEKIAKAKAEADAKAAAEAAAKAAADKAALEKAAAEREAADKAAAEVRAAAEAVVKAEEVRAAAAEAKAAAVTVKPVVTKSGTKLTLDLPDKYYGKIVTIYVGTTVKGKTTYKKLDYFVLDKEDGTADITTKMKLKKGQTIQVKVGSKVVKSVRL